MEHATLHDHDHIHVLLRRGQANNDEAFVIGFTMGNDDRTKSWEVKLFKLISRWFYPKAEKFTKNQLKIFDSGFKYGRSKLNLYQRIGEMDWTKIDKGITLRELRTGFGL